MCIRDRRIAHQPAGILHSDDASRYDLAAEGIPLADFLDRGRNLVVQRCNRRGLPVGFIDFGAEFVRPSEGRILLRDIAP